MVVLVACGTPREPTREPAARSSARGEATPGAAPRSSDPAASTPSATAAVPGGEPERDARPPAVRTEPLAPVAHRVELAALPPPDVREAVRQRPEVVAPPEGAVLRAPPGFEIDVFADRLDAPRWLAITPSGEVLVTETRENRITLLADRDGDGRADERSVFADDDLGHRLDIPFGMAFTDGRFYVGCQAEVRRFPYRAGQLAIDAGEAGERITELPGGGYNQHWTRNVIVAPDGAHLFVSVGSASDHDPEPAPRATIQIMDLDGGGRRTFASGLRNPVGLDLHPRTGELWATVNERDHLGDDLVPDMLARVRDRDFFGWPWVYLAPHLRDPRLARRALPPEVARTVTPPVLFQAHSAPLGLAFYDRDAFPARYRGGAFVAFRGSWNRRLGTGYGIAFVPFDESGQPTGGYEDFVTGFLLDPSVPRVFGRPVGVAIAPDGSVLFTEESNGRIYRVAFRRR
jgi:glucose/arabinose dehydrogenase